MTTLLEITDDLMALDDLIESVDGDITDPSVVTAINNWLDELNTNLSEKVDNYAALITDLKGRADIRKQEADRLSKRATTDSKTAKYLTSRLLGAMQDMGINKVDTDRYFVSVAKNGGKCPLDIHGEVPHEFSVVRLEPDKNKIREALEGGEALRFAILQARGTHLNIK